MIDCENEVFTKLAIALREKVQGIFITGEYTNTPPTFPHVSVVMADNSLSSVDSDFNEISIVMFEINIYSNLANGKKAQCREIAKIIDNILLRMNFSRISMTPVPNLQNSSIYRIVARYRVATDGKFFYRR